MPGLSNWISAVTGAAVLAAITIYRRRPGAPDKLQSLWNGLSLLSAGLIIGPLPWILDKGGETVRIAASAASVLASVSGALLVGYWRIVGMRRPGA